MIRPTEWADAAVRHPWRTVGWWVAALVASGISIAMLLGNALDAVPATTNDPEAQQAADLLDEHMGDRPNPDELVVLRSSRYTVDDLAFRDELERLTTSAVDAGAAVVDSGDEVPRSANGHAALLAFELRDGDEADAARRLVRVVRAADRSPDFAATVTGQWSGQNDIDDLSARDLHDGELKFGLPVAMLVLLLVFGTVVGALVPLLLAVVSIVCALAMAALVGIAFDISVFLVNMVSGMGLALGIDYSLFVLSRYREERGRGRRRDDAIAVTSATANRAVLFSGMTFVIALVGMLLIPTTIMRSLALGAILVGITTVLAALTLLPALLRLLGDRVDALTLPWVGAWAKRQRTDGGGGWSRVVRLVMRYPWPWAVAVTALLLALASPVLDLRTGASGVATLPPDMLSRRGYEQLRESFPQAAYNPARVVVEAGRDRAAAEAGVRRLRAELARHPDRFGPAEVTNSDDAAIAVVDVSVGADPRTDEAVAAVRELRDRLIPRAFGALADDGHVLVTGETAFNIDYFDVMRQWTLPVFGFVLGLSFALLTLVFRSLVVPLKAILLNLVSVSATYGILVLVFQKGYGAELLGMQRVHSIEAWVPLFLFSVLFGLSMDYHMFLLTRIREHWSQTGSTARAVDYGVSTTARLITGAALIIVAVFLGFASGELQMFQQMGLGIAIALLIDATLVRGILLPATMQLLGDRNWYLPGWLQWLPEVQLEHQPDVPD